MPTDVDTICEAIGIHRATFFRKMARLENGNGKRPVMSDEMKPAEELGAIHQRAIAKSEAARNENQLKRDSKLRQNRDERQQKREAERKLYVRVLSAYQDGFKNTFPKLDPIHWAGKEYGQAKTLISNIGEDRARLLVEYVFRNWHSLKSRWKVVGVPTMGIILGFGVQLISELIPQDDGAQVDPALKAKWEADARKRMGLPGRK